MSFWSFSPEGHQMGDAAADAVGRALEALTARRAGSGAPLPGLGELVGALQDGVSSNAELFADPEVARSGQVRCEGVTPEPAPDDVARTVQHVLEALAAVYREVVGRPPHAQEVVYAFAFVLRAGTGDFVRPPFPQRVQLSFSVAPGPG